MLLLSLITILSLKCSNNNTYTSEKSVEAPSPNNTKLTFVNGGLKDMITVELDTSNSRIKGSLIKAVNYEKEDTFYFTSDQSYQQGSKICVAFKEQEAIYPLPVSEEENARCWWLANNEAGAFGLHIPTHGKNYDTGEYQDYTMFLEQVKE